MPCEHLLNQLDLEVYFRDPGATLHDLIVFGERKDADFDLSRM